MSGGGERLHAAAERYPNPSADWRILAKPLSEAFGTRRNGTERNGTGRDGTERDAKRALAKNAALLGIADLLRHDETERNCGKRDV